MMSVRSGQPGINSQDFGKFEFLLPPLPEQKKIAEILSTWDEAINSNERLLQFVKQQKSVYVNKIFMGRHFANIDDKKAFEKLSRHIVEKTDRNKSDNTSDVLSVSNTKGFVLQSDQFEREIASKDKNNYKIIRKGQFAYNPSRVNVGSIDQLTERDIGIISPMYVVFECKDTINSRYLYHFLKSEYFLRLIPRFTQGSVRDSLSFDGLSNMKIHIPSIYKQVKYSSLLDTFDEKIKVLERKNDYLKMQKQGLMQRLLTGKIRVKLD
jgi:type I restriction enzyme S subunit